MTEPEETPGAPRTPWRYLPVDLLTMGYALIVFLALALLGGDLPHQTALLAFHLGIFVLVRVVVPYGRRSRVRFLRFLTDVYPLILYSGLYVAANCANTLVFADPFDPVFRGLDRWLFGVEPCVWLAQTFGSPVLHEILHGLYATYYVQVPAVALVYYFTRRDRAEFQRYLFTICLTFYASYLVFIVLPVHGPFLTRASDYAGGTLFVPLMDAIYAVGETGGGAFPSSHVAVALVCLIFCYRHSRWLFGIWLIPFIGLTIATVYCRYHYAVDSLAGLLWGVIFYWVGVRIHDAWLHRKR